VLRARFGSALTPVRLKSALDTEPFKHQLWEVSTMVATSLAAAANHVANPFACGFPGTFPLNQTSD